MIVPALAIKFYMNILFCLLFALFLIGCGNNDETRTENKDIHKEEEHDEHKNEIVLSDEQIKIMGIELEKYQNQNISGYISVNGEVMMNQDQESKVGSIISGRVKKIYVKEGSYVKAGQVLAVIENPELINIQVEYINAKNEYEYSKTEYERQLKLSKDNIGSKKTLAELEARYKSALTLYKTYEEKLASFKISKTRFDRIYEDTVSNLQRYYSVTSPISGNVISRMVTVGQYIEPSVDMFHIVNTSNVFIDLNVFEKDLPYISAGQKIRLDVNVDPYENYEGVISFVNKIFDDKNRTVKVRAAINNKNGKLLPFMFVSAKIYVNESSSPAVPVSALETEGQEKYIFIKTQETKEIESHEEHEGKEKNSDNHEKKEPGIVFKKIIVNTGISDDRYIVIFPLEEIKEGDEIVTKGSFYLKSELKKGEIGDDHGH